jgi:hypothetical protein
MISKVFVVQLILMSELTLQVSLYLKCNMYSISIVVELHGMLGMQCNFGKYKYINMYLYKKKSICMHLLYT